MREEKTDITSPFCVYFTFVLVKEILIKFFPRAIKYYD